MSWLSALFGCAAASVRPVASLPATFTPTVVDADEGVLYGFEGGPFEPLAARRLAAWKVGGAAPVAVGPGGPGWYRAVDSAGGETWAVVATPRADGMGSDWRLLVGSADTWTERGPIPATSVTGVVVEGGGVGWAVGVQQLWRTADGGATWAKIVGAPAPGNVAETLGVVDGRLVLGGARLLATADAGATWATLLDGPVPATDGRWVVSGNETGLRVGKVGGAAVEARGSLPEGWVADAVRGDGETVRVRANKLGSSRVTVYTSADGGRTFQARDLSGVSDLTWVGLGREGVLWMDVRRSVWRLDSAR